MKFITGLNFRYDIRECIPHYYEIQGISNNEAISITLVACDLDELCQTLQKQGQNIKIKKVFRFDKPVLPKDDNGADPTSMTRVNLPKGFISKCSNVLAVVLNKKSKVNKTQNNISLSYGDTSVPNQVKHLVGPPVHGDKGLLKLSSTELDFYAFGNIQINDLFSVDADNEGDLTDNIMLGSYLEAESLSSINDVSNIPTARIPLLNFGKRVSCCTGLLPLVLEFRHNLNLIPDLNRFLNRNGLVLTGLTSSDFIKLSFSDREQLWVGNLHLTGNSTISNGLESWDFNINFGCDEKGNWNFVLFVILTRSDKRTISRLSASFPNTSVCQNGNFYKLNFSFANGTASFASATTVNDEGQLFRNLQFLLKINSNNSLPLEQLAEDNTAAYNATLGD